jgi:glucosamine 6-phosphate synthetase-like amidotransferase/phosphosugar isomerase protein
MNYSLKGYLNDSVSITVLIDVYQEKRDVELDYVKALKDYQRITAPIIFTIPLQLLSYHVALIKGTDVDQPRN